LDQRHFALAHASVAALRRLGVWEGLAREAQAIRSVEVSCQGAFGRACLRAEEFGVEALGHTVPAPALGARAVRAWRALQGITRHAPARLTALAFESDRVIATIEGERAAESLAARLVVAADGTDSAVRRFAGIGVQQHDYGQSAVVGTLALSRDLEGRAYERLSRNGPLALLPLAGARAGFVWSVAATEAASVLALPDTEFLAALQRDFGWRAGRFRRVGRRQAWPLRAVLSNEIVGPRVALAGNAAQTIHPLGAQGFNLGLRDAMALAGLLRGAAARGADPGAPELLSHYAAMRTPDRQATWDFADGLTRLAARDDVLSEAARSLALAVVGRAPLWKQELGFGLMGYRGSHAA
jgi:2-octaprenyl-6-methoxyphenol hydroxylase